MSVNNLISNRIARW